jgi:hypothetical protein
MLPHLTATLTSSVMTAKERDAIQRRSISAAPAPSRPTRRLTMPNWTIGLSLN